MPQIINQFSELKITCSGTECLQTFFPPRTEDWSVCIFRHIETNQQEGVKYSICMQFHQQAR